MLFGSISFFLIVLSIVLLVKSSYSSDPILFLDRQGSVIHGISTIASDSASTIKFLVDVAGAVHNPGVVTLPSGSRVEDAIGAAGGLRQDADFDYIAKSINKAMKVSDGMKLYIPSKTETSHNITPLLRRSDETSQNGGGEYTISINTASKDQLDTLPGIGPVTSQKIIDNRPYQTIDELVTKKAVGQAVFEKIKLSLSL